ncbi:MAG: transglycosylase domain-containing protein [Deltaproteobacteria bacterium]|nr:transglycosylase domain-containing protein [Deltaproteobacteria bacterium]
MDQLRARGKRFRDEEHTPLPPRSRKPAAEADAARSLRVRLDEVREQAATLNRRCDEALSGLRAARKRAGSGGARAARAQQEAEDLGLRVRRLWATVEQAVSDGTVAKDLAVGRAQLARAQEALDGMAHPTLELSRTVEEGLDAVREEGLPTPGGGHPDRTALVPRSLKLAEETHQRVVAALEPLRGCAAPGASALIEAARASDRMCAASAQELRERIDTLDEAEALHLIRLGEEAAARALRQVDEAASRCAQAIEQRDTTAHLQEAREQGRRARAAAQAVASSLGTLLREARAAASDEDAPAVQRSYHKIQTHATRVRQAIGEALAATDQLDQERDATRAKTLATRAERLADEATGSMPDLSTAMDQLRQALAKVQSTPSTDQRTAVASDTPDGTQIADPEAQSRTVVSGRTPDGGLAGGILPPNADPALWEASDPLIRPRPTGPSHAKEPAVASKTPPTPKKRGLLRRLLRWTLGASALLALAGLAAGVAGYVYLSKDLPSIETLQGYEPPAVTEVYDHKGRILGEIYEERRYVRPLDEIPKHVQDAFISAEDANFWDHGGVDWMGIVRAFGRNALEGRMAQGASTITQQVTRNFLLTREKKIKRKLKEMILALRIEEAYDKDHILYLYLNQIYLGSQAYGVEAASRTYFDKSVTDLTVAEAAILAGLPQRPSDYSPHRHWSKARARQKYVIYQMQRNGYLTEAEAEAALAEHVNVVQRRNDFLETAPHFTEYARRYLVDRYGEDRVINEGLRITTTCDLDLQRVGQDAVTRQVNEVDQRMGFRREGITQIGKGQIQEHRDKREQELKDAWVFEQDAARRIEQPAISPLTEGEIYQGAVITEVNAGWARVGLGAHDGLIPLEWSKWVYKPDPARSWRYRDQTTLLENVDSDGDGEKDGPILRVGDVVRVKVEKLSTRDAEVEKAFKRTPGSSEELVAMRLWQDPEVEAALLSMEVKTGAVRTMVGGSDFLKSQFNRAIQSRRQVGSTFKPIVYGAAIESKRVTTATIVADAPIAFAASTEDFIWKPANYGNDYMGNITLRKALALSRNTCTIRVLESIDPGMNEDVVYAFARKLGIGGNPAGELPEGFIPTPENDLLCPWVRETPDSTICMDRFPAKDPELTNTRHRQLMKPDDVYMCRACDMSMGLGSASLTMEELVRAYSAFATDGTLVQPYFVEKVEDRNGHVLEQHEVKPPEQVIDPAVASVVRWLLRGVVQEGTAAAANRLGLEVAGKTGTTNDEKDAWFVGFNNDVISAAWVGFDQPRSLGVSSTGGRTALPIWMDYMKVAIPKQTDIPFAYRGGVDWISIDEATGRRVTSGGRLYPFLSDTVPESTGGAAGQVTLEDMATEL